MLKNVLLPADRKARSEVLSVIPHESDYETAYMLGAFQPYSYLVNHKCQAAHLFLNVIHQFHLLIEKVEDNEARFHGPPNLPF